MNFKVPKTLGSFSSSSRHKRTFRCCRGIAQNVPKIAMVAFGVQETTFARGSLS
jgi:hypothetical protein